jgi:NAD(P)-dependent dehydrogenase (short-subunit alcohol dehydrogenase family)
MERVDDMDEAEVPGEARLDGEVAVVTGGGRGIGHAAAITLARAGASVMVTARTESEIEETAAQIRQEGGSAQAFAADVSDWEAMANLDAETERAFGPVDIVVANAGVIEPVGDTWEVEPQEWAQNMAINLTGVFYTVRAFLPTMVEQGHGILIFTSSGAATHPVAGWSAYCAAKAGLNHFVRNLTAEIDEKGLAIRTHVFYPGIVDTVMQKQVRGKSTETFSGADKYRSYHERGWLRPPEEPAALVWWLATPLAAEFHGEPVSIDDPVIRRRMAEDLGLPPLRGRGE